MLRMLAKVADPFGVPVLTSGGFDSLTAKHDLARELAAELDTGTRAEILHIGDLDPSGEHLFTSLAEDVAAMCKSLCGAEPAFTRLAVTREQADRLGLPTAPPKATDRRSFEGDTVQCEAIDPATLSGILRDAIKARRDPETACAVLALEADFLAALVAKPGAAIDDTQALQTAQEGHWAACPASRVGAGIGSLGHHEARPEGSVHRTQATLQRFEQW